MQWRRPLHSTIALFRSPIYTIGCIVATTSWGFHVLALGLAPISRRAVGDRGRARAGDRRRRPRLRPFRHPPRVDRRRASPPPGSPSWPRRSRARPTPPTATTRTLALCITIGLATLAGLRLASRADSGPALAVSAGLLWAGSDVTIKALSGKAEDLGAGVIVHPFAFVIVALSLIGLLVSARSLQIGPAVPVIALTSATANVITIAAGPIVFQEPLPDDPFALLVRLAAFALVITAAAMTPPPMQPRAQSAQARRERRRRKRQARDQRRLKRVVDVRLAVPDLLAGRLDGSSSCRHEPSVAVMKRRSRERPTTRPAARPRPAPRPRRSPRTAPSAGGRSRPACRPSRRCRRTRAVPPVAHAGREQPPRVGLEVDRRPACTPAAPTRTSARSSRRTAGTGAPARSML